MGQCHAPAALYPRKRPSTHCTGCWVGPKASQDRCGKSRPQRNSVFGPSGRYTDYATRPINLVRLLLHQSFYIKVHDIFNLKHKDNLLFWTLYMVFSGDRSSTVVVLCYKSEGRWFDPSWCLGIFQ